MELGSNGVEQFKERRSFLRGHVKYFLFHCGSTNPNEAVAEWLASLESQISYLGRDLIQLVREMLQLNPKDRPSINQVTARLRLIAIEATAEPVRELYSKFCEQGQSTALGIECERFLSWCWAIGIHPTGNALQLDERVSFADSSFTTTLDILSQISNKLREIQFVVHTV